MCFDGLKSIRYKGCLGEALFGTLSVTQRQADKLLFNIFIQVVMADSFF